MAQVATDRSFLRHVAVHARDHAGGDFLGENVALLDRTVATGTLHIRVDVARMTEKNEVGHAVDSDPI